MYIVQSVVNDLFICLQVPYVDNSFTTNTLISLGFHLYTWWQYISYYARFYAQF